MGRPLTTLPTPLRNRIRWEIIKDGANGGAISQFSEKCQKFAVDKLSLILKVAQIKEAAADDGNQIVPGPKLMNDIEMALIHEMRPLMNEQGKKRYRRGSIEIFNSGNLAPLPEMIKK